jgi:toxin ParE1/3/4
MVETEYELVWSPESEQDLLDIWAYSARRWSLEVADRRLEAINASCERLRQSPFSGRARDELRRGLRSVVIRPHVVFYRVAERNVDIVRVLDGRRDLDAIFAEHP